MVMRIIVSLVDFKLQHEQKNHNVTIHVHIVSIEMYMFIIIMTVRRSLINRFSPLIGFTYTNQDTSKTQSVRTWRIYTDDRDIQIYLGPVTRMGILLLPVRMLLQEGNNPST